VKENTISPDALLSLLQRVKENYLEPPAKLKRGKKSDYSNLSFLLLAAVAVITRTYKDTELHKLLSQDDQLRKSIGMPAVPHRTTIGRRLNGLVPEAEQQISLLGNKIVEEVKPLDDQHEVSAIDGRTYQAQGPKWHKKDRDNGSVPPHLHNVDTQSSWSKSGYRGWVGYRLVMQCLVFP